MKEKFESLVEHLVEGGFFLEQAVEILERSLISRVLEKTNGNRCAASKQLGIHRNTLQRKMVQYELCEQRPQRKPARRERPGRKARRAKAG